MQCRECMRSKFNAQGECENCGTVSFEMQDKIKNDEYETKKRGGKL